ncbi:MAG: stage II sporulation protein M [Planctomycetota bacterium]
MKAQPFAASRAPEWREFESLVRALNSRAKDPELVALRSRAHEFPALYGRLCRDLALARQRDFDPDLVERLNRLALDGHRILHKDRTSLVGSVGVFLARDFPRAVRREAGLVGWAHLAFWGPFVAMLVLGQTDPGLLVSLIGNDMLAQIEEMYEPSNEHLGVAPDESRFMAFGFYIYNNIGIAFRTFGGGLLFGVGSLFFLVFNGLIIGGIVAHLVNLSFHETFLPFGVGHGSVELTGIVLSGAAGMKVGGALIRPGRRSRKRALVEEGRRAIPIVYGATVFLFLAAIIEAFWSPSPVPATVKYVVGGAGWLAVAAYLLFAGRRAR